MEDARITQLKLDNLYDDLEATYVEAVENKDCKLNSTRIGNPYRGNSGDFDLTETEIRQVRGAMDAKSTDVEKRALLTGWYGAKRDRLREGFRKSAGGDLADVRRYFNGLVASNDAQLAQCRQETNDPEAIAKMAEQKAAYDANANGEYKWVLSGNGRKTNALRELARVSCQMGGSGW